MMTPCDDEQLERLVRGQLPLADATATEAHVRECDACRDELALLRAERAAFAVRAAAHESVPAFESVLALARGERAAPAVPPHVAAAPVTTPARLRSRRGPVMIGACVGALALAAAAWFGFHVPTGPLPSPTVSITPDPSSTRGPNDESNDTNASYAAGLSEQCTEDDFAEERRKLPPKNGAMSCDESGNDAATASGVTSRCQTPHSP